MELSTGPGVLGYGGVLEDGEEGEAVLDFKEEGDHGSSGCFFSNHRSWKTYIEGN